MFTTMVMVFICCFFFLVITRHLCVKIDLVDKPNYRKKHTHPVPLVGGIAIYLTILFIHFSIPEKIPHAKAYLVSGGLLLIVGIIDDRFDLSVITRVIVHIIAAAIVISDGVYINSFGMLWFGNEFTLGITSYVVSLLAIGTAINIFNMVDGIDGLLAGLSIVSLNGLATCFFLAGQHHMMNYCICLIATIVPFMLLNLGVPFGDCQKVFMGDAGSTLLGFTVIWLVMMCSQGEQIAIAPSNSLWLIALPLVDMVGVTLGRIKNKQSPFRPDRTHFHHLLLKYGFSAKKTLAIMVSLGIIYSAVGVSLQINHVNECLSLCMFICLFVLHCLTRKKLIHASDKNYHAE